MQFQVDYAHQPWSLWTVNLSTPGLLLTFQLSYIITSIGNSSALN